MRFIGIDVLGLFIGAVRRYHPPYGCSVADCGGKIIAPAAGYIGQ